MQLAFTKMEGLGNDFILLNDLDLTLETAMPYPDLSRKLCSRHFGIGADGIILALPSQTHDIRYRVFNPDGSEADMCGNGMRCFARFLYEKQILNQTSMKIQTQVGTIVCELHPGEENTITAVTVDMGEPALEPERVPFLSEGDTALDASITVNGSSITLSAVSMGNPHAVIFVDDVNTVDLHRLGRAIEIHERFPKKTNVEFIRIISRNEFDMRVWERAVGETMACGTGACASLVAAHLTGRTGPEALVHLAGGDLSIRWDKTSNHLFKTGPAATVFEGSILL